jgi:hypothetical protein
LRLIGWSLGYSHRTPKNGTEQQIWRFQPCTAHPYLHLYSSVRYRKSVQRALGRSASILSLRGPRGPHHPIPPLAPRPGSLSTPCARRPEEPDAAGERKRRSPPPVVTPTPSVKEDLGGPPDLAPTWRRPPNLAPEKGPRSPRSKQRRGSDREEEGEGRSSRELRRCHCAMEEEGGRGLPGHRVRGRRATAPEDPHLGGRLPPWRPPRCLQRSESRRAQRSPSCQRRGRREARRRWRQRAHGEQRDAGKRSSGCCFARGIRDHSIASAFLSSSVKRFWHVGHVGYTDDDAGGAVRPALG